MVDIPEGPAYIVKVIVSWREPADELFQLYQVLEHAQSLDADNAATIVEELVHLAAHLDLAASPIHGDLAGTALAQHFFDRRVEAFSPPPAGRGLLVIDLVRRYLHVHRDILFPQRGLFDGLRRLGFEVAQTDGRWRRPPYQSLWRAGKLLGVFPRSPLARVEREQEVLMPFWVNPRLCREVIIPYPIWPPKPATPELMARIARWTPQRDALSRYELALPKLSPASDAYRLGEYLARHEVVEISDWFEAFAPLCYQDNGDPRNVLSNVLKLESESPDGETLAGALIRLAAKMRSLDYRLPEIKGERS